MAITTIPWNDGSGDNITLTYPAASGNQTVAVSSDENTNALRVKNVTFSSGGISRNLTIVQEGVPQQHTVSLIPSSYDDDHQYYSLSNAANAYTDETSANYAQIGLTRGSAGAVTYIYFKFDTSSIPAAAQIVEVSCVAKYLISTTTASYVSARQIQMFSGTTAKGTANTMTSSQTTAALGVGNWTRQELSDARIRLYATRGTQKVTTSYTMRFYGATLTVKYTLPYTLLTYIQTDGTAYINTGIKANVPISAELKTTMVRPSGSTNLYFLGARGSTTSNRIAPLVINSSQLAGAYYYNSLLTTKSVSDSLANYTPFETRFSARYGSVVVQTKEAGDSDFTEKTGVNNNTVTSNIDMTLFAFNANGTISAPRSGERLYYCKIYGDDTFTTLVFDGVPCYYNGQFGLWDFVSDSFFGNAAGSGAFIGG